MRVYSRKDGSRTINGTNYKEIDKLGGVRDFEVWDYYNEGGNHLIAIEINGIIKEYQEFDKWEDFEDSHGKLDPYDDYAQAFSFLRLHDYL